MRTLLDFLADTGRPGCPAAIQGEAEGFLLYAELYAWGKVTIRLIGCGFREGEVLPRGAFMLHRFSYRSTGEVYETSLTYSLFGEEAENVQTLDFTCSHIRATEQLLRYTEHVGLPAAALLREQTAMFSLQLLTKAYALDDSGLTPQERALLDGAWFAVMNAPPEYADTLAALYGENGLEEESRIREVRACAQIESSSFLKETIEAFHEADEIGDIGRLCKAQSDLFRILEDPANRELHRFYHSLFDAFLRANEAFPPRRETEETQACLQNMDASLRESGFTGKFPHYRRRRGQRGEYLSFAWSLDLEQEEPAVRLHLVSGTAFLKEEAAGPIPFKQSNAFDCEWATSKGHCAILGAFSTLAQGQQLLQEAELAFAGKAIPVGRKVLPAKAALSAAGLGALAGGGVTLLLYALVACALFVGKLMGRAPRWLLLTQLRFWGCFALAAVLAGALTAVIIVFHLSRYPLGKQRRSKTAR